MPDWSKQNVPSLRTDRNLLHTGNKKLLVARLEATDDLPLTPEERDDHYTRIQIEHDERSLRKFKGFPQFAKLPTELRETIWKLSLPGPRVLRWVMGGGKLCATQLCFPGEIGGGKQPPNPAQLFVCTESRAVALKRYKLVFGTGNVYADSEGGGGVLFLDGRDLLPWEWVYDKSPRVAGRIVTSEMQQVELCESVQDDLRAAKHILLSWKCWNRYENGHDSGGYVLRRSLEKYFSLERVSLSDELRGSVSSVFTGYFELDDPILEREPSKMKQALGAKCRGALPQHSWPREWGSARGIGTEKLEKWKEGHEYAVGHYRALRLMRGFDLHGLGDVDREEGIPECRFVKVRKVLAQPKRVIEERKKMYLGSDDEDLGLDTDAR